MPRGFHSGSTVEAGVVAAIHAGKEMGKSLGVIVESVPYSYNTVRAVLSKREPDKYLVDAILKREAAELALAGGLARNNIIKRLSEGQGNIIENTAVMDKTFQQRQLIAGNPTDIFAVQHKAILEAKKSVEEADKHVIDVDAIIVD